MVSLSWSISSGATTYQVLRNGAEIGGLVSGGNTFADNLGLVAGQTYTYAVIASGQGGTTASNTIVVTIPATVCASFPATPPANCSIHTSAASLPRGGGEVTLTATCTSGGVSDGYRWTGGFANATRTTEGRLSGLVATTTTFTVVAENSGGSSSPVSLIINVAEGPLPPKKCDLRVAPNPLPAQGGYVSLTAVCEGGPPESYEWSGAFEFNQVPTGAGRTGLVRHTTEFSVVAKNSSGESNRASATVSVSCDPGVNAAGSSLPPSLEHLAALAEAAYGRAAGVQGYCELPLDDNVTVGLGARQYRSSNGDWMILAIAGTDDWTDWLADASFSAVIPTTDKLREQVRRAAVLVRNIAERYPQSQLVLTGHSLGGAIAHLLGVKSGATAVAFNSPRAAGNYSDLQSELEGVPYRSTTIAGSQLSNYRVYGDLVSLIGRPFDNLRTETFDPPIAKRIVDMYPHLTFKAMHGIDVVRERLTSNASRSTALELSGFGEAWAYLNIRRGLASLPNESVADWATRQFFSVTGLVDSSRWFSLDPGGVDIYTYEGSAGSPRVRVITMPYLSKIDAVFRLETFESGGWKTVGHFNELESHDFGSLGVEKFRVFVLERATLRPPTDVEPFLIGIIFVSSGSVFATLSQQPTAQNYQGLWWNAPGGTESGWGVNITHQGDALFATWFTYDLDGSGMWLVMSNGTKNAEGRYSGTLYRAKGPGFAEPWDAARVSLTDVGRATFTFTTVNNGTFEYTVNGISQAKSITRFVFSTPVPLCTPGVVAGERPIFQDLWWHAPAGSESGWGINLAHQGDTIFATWFTFDSNGKGEWFVMSNGVRTGTSKYSGTLYRPTGPAFNASPWDPSKVVLTPVGTGTLSFSDTDNGTFAYNVDGFAKSTPITRYLFANPPTTCH